MTKKSILVWLAAFLVSIALAGCGGKGEGEGKAKKGGDPTEGGKYTFAAYCDFAVEQYKKATADDDFDEEDYGFERDNCMAVLRQLKNQIDDKNKLLKAEAAYTKHVLTKCEGKEGADWRECRRENGSGAMEAAQKAIQ